MNRLCLVVLTVGAVTLVAVSLPRLYLGDVAVYRAGGAAAYLGQDMYGLRVGRYGFTYPPFAAVFLGPLAALPLRFAWAVMALLSVASAVVVVRLSAPLWWRGAVAGSARPAVALAMLLLCEPLVSTVSNGQINLVLAALVIVDLLVLRRGVLIGLAAAVKLTPALFIVYLLCTGRRREAGTALGAFAFVTGGAWLLMPAASRRFWSQSILGGAGIGDTARTANQSMRGLLERALHHPVPVYLWLLAVLPVVAFGLVRARYLVRAGHEISAIGVIGLTSCVASPVSWSHHWVWVVPWIAGALSQRTPRRLLVVGIGGAWALLVVRAAWRSVIDGVTPAYALVGCGYAAVAVVVAGAVSTRLLVDSAVGVAGRVRTRSSRIRR